MVTRNLSLNTYQREALRDTASTHWFEAWLQSGNKNNKYWVKLYDTGMFGNVTFYLPDGSMINIFPELYNPEAY